MTGEVVNLRTARKRRRRAAREQEAAANRASFGERRQETESRSLNQSLAGKRLEAHRRETAPDRDGAG